MKNFDNFYKKVDSIANTKQSKDIKAIRKQKEEILNAKS